MNCPHCGCLFHSHVSEEHGVVTLRGVVANDAHVTLTVQIPLPVRADQLNRIREDMQYALGRTLQLIESSVHAVFVATLNPPRPE